MGSGDKTAAIVPQTTLALQPACSEAEGSLGDGLPCQSLHLIPGTDNS